MDGNRALFWHYPHYHTRGATPYSAIRKGKYRLIEFYEDGHAELYDLEENPGEQTNLIEQKPRLGRKLQRKLKRWKKKVEAQDPLPNPAVRGSDNQ